MTTMTSRERVLAAIGHRETDRVPLDLGSTQNSSMTRVAYERLRAFLGLPPVTLRLMSLQMQVVYVDDDVRERLGIDTVGLACHPPDVSRERALGPDHFVDEWGIELRGVRLGGELLYYDAVSHPLAGAEDVRALEGACWPDADDPGRYRGLAAEARRLHEETPYALVGHNGDTSLFQKLTYLRGMENALVDSMINQDLFSAVMERILDVQMRRMGHYLAAVGEYLDVVAVGDDLGSQQGLLVSPETYRQMIKPFHRRFFAFIKERTRAKLHLHSCGAIADVLPDLIEIGVEAINPVQTAAAGMAPERLQREFGGRLAFWGGIDSQSVMKGSAAGVKAEVRRLRDILGAAGGYILGACHNVQADVPPGNVVAMCEAAREEIP